MGPQSWILLKIANVPEEDPKKWIGGEEISSLADFKDFIKQNTCVNNCTEGNVRFIQDFVADYKSEDMKQNLMLLARDNRKQLKKDISKSQLKSI